MTVKGTLPLCTLTIACALALSLGCESSPADSAASTSTSLASGGAGAGGRGGVGGGTGGGGAAGGSAPTGSGGSNDGSPGFYPKIYGVNGWAATVWAIPMDTTKTELHVNGDRLEWRSYGAEDPDKLDASMVEVAKRGGYVTLLVQRANLDEIGAVAQQFGPGGAWTQSHPDLASHALKSIEIENETEGWWWPGRDNDPEAYGGRLQTAIAAAAAGNPNVFVFPNFGDAGQQIQLTDAQGNPNGTWITNWNERVLSQIPDLFQKPNVGGAILHEYTDAATIASHLDTFQTWESGLPGGSTKGILVTEVNMSNCDGAESLYVTGLPQMVAVMKARPFVLGFWIFNLKGYTGCPNDGFWDVANPPNPKQQRIDATRAAIDLAIQSP
jgi:hypothetical protein